MHRNALVVDLETVAHPHAADWLDAVTPRANLTDPVKIQRDILERERWRLERLALDPYACRIVALGVLDEFSEAPTVRMARDEAAETAVLRTFWDTWRQAKPLLVTFNGLSFDLPVLITRARLLGVSVPPIDTRPFGNRDVLDLWTELAFAKCGESYVRRGLKSLARRFGLTVEDETSGGDVPALIAAGQWDAVCAHCSSDVLLTRALAHRSGVLAERHVASEAPPWKRTPQTVTGYGLDLTTSTTGGAR